MKVPQPAIIANGLANPIDMDIDTITSEKQYNIPLKYRKMENLHIVFWLFKDISWCMFWRLRHCHDFSNPDYFYCYCISDPAIHVGVVPQFGHNRLDYC